jgi:hypothetical protein
VWDFERHVLEIVDASATNDDRVFQGASGGSAYAVVRAVRALPPL